MIYVALAAVLTFFVGFIPACAQPAALDCGLQVLDPHINFVVGYGTAKPKDSRYTWAAWYGDCAAHLGKVENPKLYGIKSTYLWATVPDGPTPVFIGVNLGVPNRYHFLSPQQLWTAWASWRNAYLYIITPSGVLV